MINQASTNSSSGGFGVSIVKGFYQIYLVFICIFVMFGILSLWSCGYLLVEQNKMMKNKLIYKIEQAVKNNETVLNIGNCGLLQIPLKVFEIVSLEVLILSDIYWDHQELKHIEEHNLGIPNNISSIPIEISNLVNLKKLVLSGKVKRSKKELRERITDIQ